MSLVVLLAGWENSLKIGLEYRGVDRVGNCQRRIDAFNAHGFVLLNVDA